MKQRALPTDAGEYSYEIEVNVYADNHNGGGDKIVPMVHITARDKADGYQTITLHPATARRLAEALIKAADWFNLQDTAEIWKGP